MPKTFPRTIQGGISLGLFAADLGRLSDACEEACNWGCEIMHFDIMDGNFVPQMIGGPGFLKIAADRMLCDVHLMIEHPARQVASYVQAGADAISIHAESPEAEQALLAIREAAQETGRHVLAGLALMPGTAPENIEHLLRMKPDMLLILSLDPRNGSKPDITAACARLQALRARLGPDGPLMAFDGGVTLETIDEIAACRPDMIVSGSAILRASEPQSAFRTMAEKHAAHAARAGNYSN